MGGDVMREMKDSGIEWIGTIPASWKTIKNKYIFRLRSGEAISKEDLIDDGLYPVYGGGERIGYYNNFNVSSNSFLIGRVGARCGCVTPVNSLCWATDNALIAEFIDINDYYTYALIAADLNRLNESNAQPLITATKVLNVSIPKPDKKEQLLIAEFLSNMSNECDTLIIDIQSQIEVLEEYKRSVITEAVTKGLDPDVEMRDSGVQWIGDMPAHWSTMPNKYVMRKVKKICPKYNGEQILSLTMNGVTIRDLDAGGKMPTTFDGYQYVEPDNLLMCLFDIDVTPRCIGLIKDFGLTSPAYSQFIMSDNAFAPYYVYYYTMIDNDKTLLHLAKNLRHSLTEEQLGAISVIVPPYEEQKEIADYLDSKIAEIDSIIALKKQQIETIEEYKKSLIFEYVTGKKEVGV